MQDIYVSNDCFPRTLELFNRIYKLETFFEKNPELKLNIQKVIAEDTYFELYLNLLRLLSNIAHINPLVQNYILQNDYLLLLLNFAKFDAKNPYIREWSIVLIRNLTDGNLS